MSEKKFFWLKLKDDFFKQKTIKKLRKIAGGDTYTIIYLKMLLLSLKNDGRLFFEGVEETFEEELALDLDEDVDNVKMTMGYLQSQQLLDLISYSECVLPQAFELTGSESSSADRVRRYRQRQKMLQDSSAALQCNTDVTDSNTEIDIDKDKEKELDKEIYISIVDYLNEKASTKYKPSTPKTKSYINARLNEGFTLEDFKTVIDKKCAEWIGTEWQKFLRPETLFGTKFESYLNAQVTKQTVQNQDDISLDDLF